MKQIIIIMNLLILYSGCFQAESISEKLNSTVNGQFLNESNTNLTLDKGLHSEIDQAFNQSNLKPNETPFNHSIETNITSLEMRSGAEVTTIATQISANKTIKTKSMNRRSVDRVFGYFSTDGKFNTCPESKAKKSKDQTKGEDNEVDTTLSKCIYFSVEELKMRFSRKIESKNGFKGVFGYFYFGKFTRCEPPKRLEQDPNFSHVKYIPYDLNYDSNCKYFENDPGETFDAIPKQEKLVKDSSNSVQFGSSLIASSILVLSSLIVMEYCC